MLPTKGCLCAILTLAACGGDTHPSASTITVDPPRMLADGRTRATVIVTLRNSDGEPLAGESVELTVGNTGSALSVTSGTTDGLGVFVSSLSSTTSGVEVVSANAGGARIAREVTLDPIAPACGFLLDTGLLMHVADVNKDGGVDLLTSRGLLLARGDGIFDPPLPGPPLASIGDVDGDGDLDAVDINLSQGVIVSLGSGDGTFVLTSVAQVPSPTFDPPAVGDFNGDGAADVAIVTQGTERVVAVLGSNGDGTLQAAADTTIVYPLTFPQETGSILVLAADLDEDGRSDLLAIASPTATIEVALANANGTFQSPTSISRGTTLGFVATDIDGDGHVDLAGISGQPAEVWIFRGRGDGTFETPHVIPSGSDIHSIAAGDLNRDGHRDLVLGLASGISFAHGNGDGTFGALVPVPGGEGVGSTVAVGDFDGDGFDDLAAQVGVYGTMILLGDGQRFGPRTSQLDIPAGLNPDFAIGKIVDLDSDGHPDLVLSVFEVDSSLASLGTFRGRGDGTFEPLVEVTPSYVFPFVFADFDRDGDRDLVGSVVDGSTVDLYRNEAGALTFAASLSIDLVNRDVAIGDVDGDGRLDIVVAGIGDNSTMSIVTFLGDGLGGFSDSNVVTVVSEPTNGPHGLAVGDLDGDGFSDVAISSDGGISILFGRPDGTFGDPIQIESSPVTLAIEDMNGDGALDLVSGSNEITAYLNTGNRLLDAGLVYFPADAANGFGSGALTILDFDRDGILDVATSTGLIGFGVGDGTFARSERYPPFDAIGDLDHDGTVDLLSGLRVSQVCR